MTGLDFDERFGLLVDAEWIDRQNKRLARNLREAKLRLSDACIEGIDYPPRRKLDKAVIRGLASCAWVQEHHNVVITGPTGVGKTYIACALAQQACRKGYRALYRRVPRIFDEILLARADGTYPRWLAKVARFDIVVLDDWGLVPLAESERRDLLEIMEDRYGNRSTILTSQMPVAQWHDQVGDPTIADAFCDRLLHNAHRIELHGPSRRQEKKKQN
jgi:DNA replication protein DnaC